MTPSNPQPDFPGKNQSVDTKRHDANFGGVWFSRFRFLVVSAAEILFEPEIEANEQIAAAHFLDFEFGNTSSAIAPSNRHRRPRISANDRL